ncbi:MAG: nucleoside monophosphate kinase [Candidatus Margulisiibacteriota bacterium]
MAKAIVFLGPPACGKGTQSEILSQSMEALQISTGMLLRKAIAEGTPAGLEAQRYVEQGLLVPDAPILDMVADQLGDARARNGVVFDGFPRTLNQAQQLSDLLEKANISVAKVFLIEVDLPEVIFRIAGRLECPKCKRIYHAKLYPPKVPGVCDVCQTRLVHRSDDTEDKVKKRYAIYEKEIGPIVAYYGVTLVRINGQQAKEVIAKQIAQFCL